MLTRLSLGQNSIGKTGVKYLAESLLENTVSLLISIIFLHNYLLLVQTLIILEIGRNEIGNEGTKYLADVLKHNTVSLLHMCSQLLSCILYSRIDTQYTRSPSKQYR